MRNSTTIILAFAAMAACAPANATTTFTTAQYAKAAAGIDAMQKLNLLTFGDATIRSDVEGKAFIGGNLSGGGTIALGGSKSFKASDVYRSLTVGGNLNGGVNVNNGIGVKAIEVAIGGNSSGSLNVNLGAASTAKALVGGSFNAQNFNPNAAKTAAYGTTATNVQQQDRPFVKQDAALAIDMKAGIARVTASYQDELTTLASVLGALTSNATLVSSDQNNIHFDYGTSASTDAYVVANVTASQLARGTFKAPTLASNKTMIINVSGSSATLGANATGDWASAQQNIIWNFTDATQINVNVALFGSVLAPKATVSGNSPINGTVIANIFNSSGEVHLGTFNGQTPFLVQTPPPGGGVGEVPEPASWLTMLLGFGVTGSALRSRRRKERLAAA